MNILLVILGCINSANWYQASCSEFVTVAKSKQVTLPSSWNYAVHKGCNTTYNSTAPLPAANDTALNFGLYHFYHDSTVNAGATIEASFELATVSPYFQSWRMKLYSLMILAVVTMILAAIHWTIKTQNHSVMYTDDTMRMLFGPGSGVFALIAFLVAILVY